MALQTQDHIAPSLDAPNADPTQGTKYDFPRDFVGYGRHPPDAQWPNGAKIAVSFVINYEEVYLCGCGCCPNQCPNAASRVQSDLS